MAKKHSPVWLGLKIISMILQWVLIIALIVVAVGSFGTRIPALAKLGLNFFAVTSGSMEPTIPTGSLLLAGKYELEDLKEGDIITFQISNPQNNQRATVTHRIAKVTKTEEQRPTNEEGKTETYVQYSIKTKGDVNNEPDAYEVNSGNVIGLYKWHLPKLGYVTSFAQTPTGFVSLVIVPAAVLILWEIVSLILYFKRHFEAKAAAELEELKAELAETRKVAASKKDA